MNCFCNICNTKLHHETWEIILSLFLVKFSYPISKYFERKPTIIQNYPRNSVKKKTSYASTAGSKLCIPPSRLHWAARSWLFLRIRPRLALHYIHQVLQFVYTSTAQHRLNLRAVWEARITFASSYSSSIYLCCSFWFNSLGPAEGDSSSISITFSREWVGEYFFYRVFGAVCLGCFRWALNWPIVRFHYVCVCILINYFAIECAHAAVMFSWLSFKENIWLESGPAPFYFGFSVSFSRWSWILIVISGRCNA